MEGSEVNSEQLRTKHFCSSKLLKYNFGLISKTRIWNYDWQQLH